MFSYDFQGKQSILQMAERIANLQSECGLSTSVEEFKKQYNFGLVEVVFEWARGMPFSEITNLTDVQEGRRKQPACSSYQMEDWNFFASGCLTLRGIIYQLIEV